MGRVCADQIAQIEEEIDAWSVESGIGSREALRDLRCRFETEAQPCWSDGGVPGLHAPPFLLAFLRQLAEQGWRFAERLPVPREEALGASVRVLRNEGSAASTSRQSGLDGQPTREHPDALHLLSSLLARHAHTAWHEAHQAYAETNFVLAHGAGSRVGRLRGYGNAIVAPQAQAFVEAVMSCV
jgi:hypothetical protein